MPTNQTSAVLRAMLRENTGMHMCDSGGIYGRHFERNRRRPFAKEPEGVVKFGVHEDRWYFEGLTLSTYHFLNRALNYEPLWNHKFSVFARRKANRDVGWLALMEEFAEEHGFTPQTVNTYNGEDLLSQVIQYTLLGDDGGLVLLQIHGGCDVRGGYTRPRAFRQLEEWSLSYNNRASIGHAAQPGQQGPHVWDYEAGWNELQAAYDGKRLDEYPGCLSAGPVSGKLAVTTPEGVGYCPLCGMRLEAWI